jgi:hypothetical protein
LGFEGPFAGGRHQFLVHSRHRLAVPSNSEYSVPQLRTMLREVEAIIGRQLSAEEWDDL